MSLQAEVLLGGAPAHAATLALTAPISFWGGVDAKTGRIADPRHPQYGEDICGRVLLVPATVGSSSAAAILLELVHSGRAPAALVLHEPDAILLLGLIVAKEMGLQVPIALRLDRTHFESLAGRDVEITAAGEIIFSRPETKSVC